VREEMMPSWPRANDDHTTAAGYWEKTDRWDDKKVDNWFKTELKNGTKLGVGLTHEEP